MILRNRRYSSGFQGMVTKCAGLIEDGESIVTHYVAVGGNQGKLEVVDLNGTVLFHSKSVTKSIRECYTENVVSLGTKEVS